MYGSPGSLDVLAVKAAGSIVVSSGVKVAGCASSSSMVKAAEIPSIVVTVVNGCGSCIPKSTGVGGSPRPGHVGVPMCRAAVPDCL